VASETRDGPFKGSRLNRTTAPAAGDLD
jgi:hypothetical protein